VTAPELTEFSLRAATAADLPFLQEMLFEAFFWRPQQPRPTLAEFSSHAEFVKLLRGWGRPGDRALLALAGGQPAGAGWFRLWSEAEHSYGFIDAATPELGLGVAAAYRGRGLGRALLRGLATQAGADGFAALSLSVEPENYSRALYESEGFAKVGENGGAWTMRLSL
jgi:ribosomal protein S18 acetylase RimI-like enzyme